MRCCTWNKKPKKGAFTELLVVKLNRIIGEISCSFTNLCDYVQGKIAISFWADNYQVGVRWLVFEMGKLSKRQIPLMYLNFYLNRSNNKANVHLLLSGIISRQSMPSFRRLTSEFSYHNRVVTSWPAVITAASSNQPSKALIKPSGKKKQAAGIEVTLDWCMRVSVVCMRACVCVFYHVSILMRTKTLSDW